MTDRVPARITTFAAVLLVATTAAASVGAQERDTVRAPRPDSAAAVRADSAKRAQVRADSVARADTGRVVRTRPLPTAAARDVAVLRNGDRVTGRLTRYVRGRLEVDGDDLGDVTVDWDDLESITAAGPFDVELFSGRRFRGALAPAPRGSITVVGDEERRVVDLRSVARILRVQRSVLAALDGDISVGVSWLKSSRTSTSSLSGSVQSMRHDRETEALLDVLVTTVEGRRETSRSSLRLGHLRYLGDRWLAGAQSRLERNRNLGYDFRATLAPQVGRRVREDLRNDVVLLGGLSVLAEVPVSAPAVQRLEGIASGRWTWERRGSGKASFDLQVRAFPGLTQWGRLRTETDLRARREVVKDLTFGISFFSTTDSRPPAGATAKSDYGITTTIGWSF